MKMNISKRAAFNEACTELKNSIPFHPMDVPPVLSSIIDDLDTIELTTNSNSLCYIDVLPLIEDITILINTLIETDMVLMLPKETVFLPKYLSKVVRPLENRLKRCYK